MVTAADVALQTAGALMEAHRFAEAKQQLARVLAERPRTAVAHRALAAIHRALGDVAKALASIARAIELNAEASSYFLLAQILEQAGALAEAATVYRLVARLDPAQSDLSTRLGVCEKNRSRSRPAPGMRPEAVAALLARATSTVSACIIVKDEAAQLPRCLGSVRPWVDEIVVVDTGSRDESVSVAEAHGARVSRFEWNDDFSAARNAAIERATSEWVLSIDADEELLVTDPEAFRRSLRNREPAAYALTLANVGPAGAEEDATSVLRLFRRRPELRYEGRLHESLAAGVRSLGWPAYDTTCIRFRHYGYQPELFSKRDKAGRNVRLAELDVRDRPDDAYARFNLFRAYVVAGKDAEAHSEHARIIELGFAPALLAISKTTFVHFVQAQLVLHERSGDWEAVLQALDRGLDALPRFVPFLLRRGRVLARRGDTEGARRDFEACLTGGSHGLPLAPGEQDTLPQRELSLLRARIEK
jgi:glycosyltransferase involved in cell wall biosynthesis/predicted negative regulator of RcsB-dependent stress response